MAEDSDADKRNSEKSGSLKYWLNTIISLPFPYLLAILISAVVVVAIGSFYCFGSVIFYQASGAGSQAPVVHDIFEDAVDGIMQSNARDLLWMERANFAVQVTLIFTSMLATIIAAITTKDNAPKLKIYSVVLTAITASVTVFLNVFHVKENIDLLIVADKKIHELQISYLAERAAIDDKVLAVPIQSLDSGTKVQLLTLHKKYTSDLSDILESRWHVWSNVGGQTTAKN